MEIQSRYLAVFLLKSVMAVSHIVGGAGAARRERVGSAYPLSFHIGSACTVHCSAWLQCCEDLNKKIDIF